MPIGAEPQQDGGVHFRVWAPKPSRIALVVDDKEYPLAAEADGYFVAHVGSAWPGARYGFRIDDDAKLRPDPASRLQPDGPHGLSCVVDPSAYAWNDAAWRGVSLEDQVITEVHIGTFTRDGTYASAAEKLPSLKDAGISLIELLPLAEFPGAFGWGYDGVSLFAPTRLYGAPDALRGFIDAAHQLGIGVLLDVVYNHLGPDGNYLRCFSDTYFTDKYPNEWGDAVNFDGAGSLPVREFFRENAAYWIREYHFDGFRLDATSQIFDQSPVHVIAELAAYARAAARERRIAIVAENEPQDSRLVAPPTQGGYGLDAVWNEDLQHTTHVALTGYGDGYYSDFTGSARELLACARHGFLYQGQRSNWQNKRRGSPALGLDPCHRINFLENHDQVSNSRTGRRLVARVEPGRLCAITAFLLLGPGVPMLFQGQEFASASPFLYFADHKPELAAAVAEGRRQFLEQFPNLASAPLDPPENSDTFRKCVLDWDARAENDWALRLHRDLIALRRNDPVLRRQGRDGLDGAVLSEEAFLLRYFSPEAGDRLMIVNLGRDLSPRCYPEPLLAPQSGASWTLLWSYENVDYGGKGIREVETADGRWLFPGHAAVVLASQRRSQRD